MTDTMAAKRFIVSIAALVAATLLCVCPPAGAAPVWVAMCDMGDYAYQVDTNTLRFTGEETDKTLDLWIKTVKKGQPDVYRITHLFIKENMMYMEKEYDRYSPIDGALISTANSSGKGWSPLTVDTPAEIIAKQLFADYRSKVKVVDPFSVTVDPRELQKALDEKKIKQGVDDGRGTKWFYVRDTCKSRGAHLTFDFWLLVERGNSKDCRLNFSMVTGLEGSHVVKKGVVVRIDGQEWLLTPPVPKGATSFPGGQTFSYSFVLPTPLVQAIMTAKGGVTLQWHYNSGLSEYTIPAEQARNIGLMYAGCK